MSDLLRRAAIKSVNKCQWRPFWVSEMQKNPWAAGEQPRNPLRVYSIPRPTGGGEGHRYSQVSQTRWADSVSGVLERDSELLSKKG